MRWLHIYMGRVLETWVEFLKLRYISAVQSLTFHPTKPSEEALPDVPWEYEVGYRRDPMVRSRRAYLHDLGCVQPERHGLKRHTCPLGDDRTIVPRALELYRRQEVPLLRAMRHRLPEELVIKILAEIVVNNNTDGVVNLCALENLQRVSTSMLSDQIPEATPYQPLLNRAILENLPIRLDVAFQPGSTNQEVVARLPEFATTVLPHIRTLVLCVGVEESLSEASNGLVSLRSQLLPFRLRDFAVEITTLSMDVLLEGMSDPPLLMDLVLESSQLETSGKRVTFREDCEAFVDAVRLAGVGRTQYLRMAIVPWDHYGTKVVERRASWTAIKSARSAAEIVEFAVRKDLGGI